MKVGYKTTLGTTELEKMGIIDRNTLSRNKVYDNYVGSPTQADRNSRNDNIHTYFLFCLVVLAVESLRKPLLL